MPGLESTRWWTRRWAGPTVAGLVRTGGGWRKRAAKQLARIQRQHARCRQHVCACASTTRVGGLHQLLVDAEPRATSHAHSAAAAPSRSRQPPARSVPSSPKRSCCHTCGQQAGGQLSGTAAPPPPPQRIAHPPPQAHTPGRVTRPIMPAASSSASRGWAGAPRASAHPRNRGRGTSGSRCRLLRGREGHHHPGLGGPQTERAATRQVAAQPRAVHAAWAGPGDAHRHGSPASARAGAWQSPQQGQPMCSPPQERPCARLAGRSVRSPKSRTKNTWLLRWRRPAMRQWWLPGPSRL